jgi:hypothetical protein
MGLGAGAIVGIVAAALFVIVVLWCWFVPRFNIDWQYPRLCRRIGKSKVCGLTGKRGEEVVREVEIRKSRQLPIEGFGERSVSPRSVWHS